MAEYTIKGKLTSFAGEFMAAVLLIQPLLDVLSFFVQDSGANAVTTLLRLGMLAAVSLYGFLISDSKQLYAAGYAVIGGFWLLHMLNCWRTGYAQPVGDAAEYLKLVQIPLWTAAFVTFFRKREALDVQIIGVLAVNFAVILLVVGLSFAIGPRVYTYDNPERGIQIGLMGWFAVHSAQSAILCLLTPAVLLWGLRTERLWIFCLCAVGSLGLLYFTGTRMTYYWAVLLAAAFVALILLHRKHYAFCFPLLLALILLVAFKGVSPMEQRQAVSATSFSAYQEKIDEIMGEDRDFVYHPGEDISPAVLEKIKTVYCDVYGQTGIYGEPLLGDLLNRFGVEKVMEEMEYSVSPQILNNARSRKLTALHMVWEEQDFLTHLLGMEYSNIQIGENIFDPENDFPAVCYFYGYLGLGLYLLFLLYFVFLVLRALFRDVAICAAEQKGGQGNPVLRAWNVFWQGVKRFLTPEVAVACMIFLLAVVTAQVSGHVLRRPSVGVYVSLAAALLYLQTREAPTRARLRSGHKRNPAVYLKKIG